jgi:hypothetical protein
MYKHELINCIMEVEGQLGLTGMLQEREGTGENANI